jgi:subfamily B ATP-binding cassette protein MsbA
VDHAEPGGRGAQPAQLGELNRITLILIASFLIRSLFYFVQNYALAYVGERIVVDLRREVYSHLHELTLRFFSDRRVGNWSRGCRRTSRWCARR